MSQACFQTWGMLVHMCPRGPPRRAELCAWLAWSRMERTGMGVCVGGEGEDEKLTCCGSPEITASGLG